MQPQECIDQNILIKAKSSSFIFKHGTYMSAVISEHTHGPSSLLNAFGGYLPSFGRGAGEPLPSVDENYGGSSVQSNSSVNRPNKTKIESNYDQMYKLLEVHQPSQAIRSNRRKPKHPAQRAISGGQLRSIQLDSIDCVDTDNTESIVPQNYRVLHAQ